MAFAMERNWDKTECGKERKKERKKEGYTSRVCGEGKKERKKECPHVDFCACTVLCYTSMYLLCCVKKKRFEERNSALRARGNRESPSQTREEHSVLKPGFYVLVHEISMVSLSVSTVSYGMDESLAKVCKVDG